MRFHRRHLLGWRGCTRCSVRYHAGMLRHGFHGLSYEYIPRELRRRNSIHRVTCGKQPQLQWLTLG